jgi:small nuclear ribonucleoprotein G
MAPAMPELKKVSFHPTSLQNSPGAKSFQYLDKRLFVQLNGTRKVIGILRGYDVRLSSALCATLSANTEEKLIAKI